MGYWSTIPMDGDFQQDTKDEFRNGLIGKFGNEAIKDKMNMYYNDNPIKDMKVGDMYNINDLDISNYELFIDRFEEWARDYIPLHEDKILKYIQDKNNLECLRLTDNQMNYIIPLSFLEWKITLNEDSKLSKYLLKLLSNTDGGSNYRGYEEKDNMYPNKLYSPYDFIKYYINNWNELISGELDYNKINSDIDITPTLGRNLINVK